MSNGVKKILKIVGIILGVLVLALIAYLFKTRYDIEKGNLIEWQGNWYTKEEMRELVPPQVYEAEAKNTPEEVYASFRQALLDNDIEKALGYIREENRGEYKTAFENKTALEAWIKRLPEKIVKENEYGNFAYYNIDMSTENKNTISFVKDENGYWQIDQI